MIDPESRRKEAVTAERLWRDRTTESITVINKQLEYDGKCKSSLINFLCGSKKDLLKDHRLKMLFQSLRQTC